MGFFTKLKKAWASPEDVAQQALDEYKKEQGIEIEAKDEPAPESAAPVVEAVAPAAPLSTPVATPVSTPDIAPDVAPEAPAVAPQKSDAAPTPTEDWQAGLTLALRQAEPKLSEWLNIIVEGVEGKGPALWERLAFLFKALGAPEDEAQKFIASFESWLDNMGYEAVVEFKSELQYRLAQIGRAHV